MLQCVQVIDAYAYIANVDNTVTSVVSTFQSQELAGQHGDFDPKSRRQWIGRLGQRCASRLMVHTILEYFSNMFYTTKH
jgi:hypothetical protein